MVHPGPLSKKREVVKNWNEVTSSRYFQEFVKEIVKNQFMVIKEVNKDEIKNDEVDESLVLDLEGLEEEI